MYWATRFLLASAAVVEALPPQALEPLAIGAATGFITDRPDVMMCGMAVGGELGDLKNALEDIKEGIKTMNVSYIQDAVQQFQAAMNGAKTAKQECTVVEDDVKVLVTALKKVPRQPKELVIHVLSNFFDDGDKIFSELAASEKAYKGGWDYMTSGQQLGMALRRMLVGELNGTKPIPPLPTQGKEQLAIGMALGFISDSPDAMTCGMSVMGELTDMKNVVADLKKGIKSLNMTEIEEALKEVKAAIDGSNATKATCNVVRSDVTAILKVIKQIKGPKDLVVHMVDHLFDDGDDIFGELSASMTAYKTGWDYMTTGQQLGMAFRRMLVGKVNVVSTTTATPEASSLVVV